MDIAVSDFMNEINKRNLHQVAYNSIQYGFKKRKPLIPESSTMPEELKIQGASFVTLELKNKLKGCIGSLEAYRPLFEDIAHNAFAAAFLDPRFSPLTQEEFSEVKISISVLTAPTPLKCHTEKELFNVLRPGQDGLIIEALGRRATFLPSVWEQLPHPKQFVDHLKLKAGLSPHEKIDHYNFWTYQTLEF